MEVAFQLYSFHCSQVESTELYYISGDRALAKKVWQKTWRISIPKVPLIDIYISGLPAPMIFDWRIALSIESRES